MATGKIMCFRVLASSCSVQQYRDTTLLDVRSGRFHFCLTLKLVKYVQPLNRVVVSCCLLMCFDSGPKSRARFACCE